MATCPTCKSKPLVPTLITDGLSARGCRQCSGALVDLVGYRAWADHRGIDAIGVEGDVSTAVEDTKTAVLCPNCTRIMTKFRISSRTRNRIDFCGHCDVAWLDRGEWAQLKELGLRSNLGSIFSEPWQRRVRESESEERSARRLRERFGEDYERIEAFYTWLKGRSDREEIVGWIAGSSNDD